MEVRASIREGSLSEYRLPCSEQNGSSQDPTLGLSLGSYRCPVFFSYERGRPLVKLDAGVSSQYSTRIFSLSTSTGRQGTERQLPASFFASSRGCYSVVSLTLALSLALSLTHTHITGFPFRCSLVIESRRVPRVLKTLSAESCADQALDEHASSHLRILATSCPDYSVQGSYRATSLIRNSPPPRTLQ